MVSSHVHSSDAASGLRRLRASAGVTAEGLPITHGTLSTVHVSGAAAGGDAPRTTQVPAAGSSGPPNFSHRLQEGCLSLSRRKERRLQGLQRGCPRLQKRGTRLCSIVSTPGPGTLTHASLRDRVKVSFCLTDCGEGRHSRKSCTGGCRGPSRNT